MDERGFEVWIENRHPWRIDGVKVRHAHVYPAGARVEVIVGGMRVQFSRYELDPDLEHLLFVTIPREKSTDLNDPGDQGS